MLIMFLIMMLLKDGSENDVDRHHHDHDDHDDHDEYYSDVNEDYDDYG